MGRLPSAATDSPGRSRPGWTGASSTVLRELRRQHLVAASVNQLSPTSAATSMACRVPLPSWACPSWPTWPTSCGCPARKVD